MAITYQMNRKKEKEEKIKVQRVRKMARRRVNITIMLTDQPDPNNMTVRAESSEVTNNTSLV